MRHLTLILAIAAAGVLLVAGTASADWGGHQAWGHHYYQPHHYTCNPYYCPAQVYPYGYGYGYTPYYHGNFRNWAPYQGSRGYVHLGGGWGHRR